MIVLRCNERSCFSAHPTCFVTVGIGHSKVPKANQHRVNVDGMMIKPQLKIWNCCIFLLLIPSTSPQRQHPTTFHISQLIKFSPRCKICLLSPFVDSITHRKQWHQKTQQDTNPVNPRDLISFLFFVLFEETFFFLQSTLSSLKSTRFPFLRYAGDTLDFTDTRIWNFSSLHSKIKTSCSSCSTF